MDRLSRDRIADIRTEQSNKMWRAAHATPIFATAIFVAWYALLKERQPKLAAVSLFFGIAVLVLHWIVIRRMAQFDRALFQVLRDDLPDFGPPPFGLRGKDLAQAVPLTPPRRGGATGTPPRNTCPGTRTPCSARS